VGRVRTATRSVTLSQKAAYKRYATGLKSEGTWNRKDGGGYGGRKGKEGAAKRKLPKHREQVCLVREDTRKRKERRLKQKEEGIKIEQRGRCTARKRCNLQRGKRVRGVSKRTSSNKHRPLQESAGPAL